jgi:hypothetical protein
MADTIFTVTVPGGTGGGYYIDGVQKPVIPVVTGGTFRFNQDAATNNNHPLILSTTTSSGGIISTGVSYYLDGPSNESDYRNTSLFNAASVRYIEITVTQTLDFYYLCTVHGFSMGNNMDVTVDSWGALNWSQGEWGHQPADITVSVTTPGAVSTTWGQSTYGNYAWNQITGIESQTGNELIEAGASVILSTNLLTSSVDTVSAQANFIIVVTGIELNTTVNNVFAGENVLVEVTTPGASTTWGQGNLGQYAWNQITGSEIDIGNETVQGTGSLNLTGVQSNTTTNIVSITANANVNLATNILNITAGTVLQQTSIDVFLTSPGDLPWGATAWNNGSWGNIGGMFVSQGAEEEATPSIEVHVSTNLLTLTLTSIAQVTADANVTVNTNLLTTSLGNEEGVPNTQVTLSTNLLNVSMGFASGEVLSTVSLTGVNMTASTGRLFIAAWEVVDIGVTNNWSVVDIAA